MIPFIQTDGGRAAAGYRGSAGDCVTRAIAIATEQPYSDVYDALHQRIRDRGKPRAGRKGYSPRDGVPMPIIRSYLQDQGWTWTPTMAIGTGCQVHLRPDELPAGRLIVRVTRHICAVIDGVIHDTHDCSRGGTRCVYGYWSPA